MASQFLANKVIDNLYVGSRYAAEDGDFLFTNQIRRVVNMVAHKVPNRFQMMNVRYLSFQFEPSSTILDQNDEHISMLVRFMQEAVENDVQVLVHSEGGDNRSIAYVAAYLVHRFHWPPEKAVEFISLKRPGIKVADDLMGQLITFSNRRREKYGNFKDIFVYPPPSKMNDMELLHRNTYLNATGTQEDVRYDIVQKSPVSVLQQHKIIPQQQSILKWRDGLTATSPPARFAQFNAQNQPVNPHLVSALFRGRTMSYKDNTVTKNMPTRVDPALVPTISYDLDIPRIHTRLPDGYLKPVDSTLAGKDVAICTKPISILKRLQLKARKAYNSDSYVVPVDAYDILVAQALSQLQPEQQNIEEPIQSADTQKPPSQIRPQFSFNSERPLSGSQRVTITSKSQFFQRQQSQREPISQYAQRPRQPSLSASQPLTSSFPYNSSSQSQYLTARQSTKNSVNMPELQHQPIQKSSFQKKRPPTPPRKSDQLNILQVQQLPNVEREKNRPQSQTTRQQKSNFVTVTRYGYQPQSQRGPRKSGDY